MSNINVTLQEGVLTLEMNRADKKNALTRQMYQAMADTLNDANQDPQVKVIKLSAAGSCFTAGNDISDFANREEGNQVAEVSAFMRALVDCRHPVVAQVHGMAVGIGTTLLLHCDLVYCEPEVKFVLPFINLGLVPEYASSYLLPKLAGRRKASEWLMLGEPFGADEAQQFGLVSGVVEADRLADKVAQVCASLAAKPQFALSHTKALLDNDKDAVEQQINVEMDLFIEAMGTEAAQEAFNAFLNKRPVNRDKFR